jgi:chorismate mutase/prephenate dehydratase
MNLKNLRRGIDGIDKKIVRLLNMRAKIILSVANLKHKEGRGAYSPDREREVLKKIALANKGPLARTALEAIYREIMSCGLSLKKPLKIAYLGPEATFTHLAALK